jgi:hypothetical protein
MVQRTIHSGEIMQIEEYEKMWAEDGKIDESNLIAESARIPQLHSKYYKLYHRAAMKAVKLRYDLKELERVKTEYYNGTISEEDLKERGWKPNPLKVLKSDIPKYIDSDKDIIELSLKIEYQSSIAKFLEDVVRSINFRRGIIQDMVAMVRFQSGVG